MGLIVFLIPFLEKPFIIFQTPADIFDTALVFRHLLIFLGIQILTLFLERYHVPADPRLDVRATPRGVYQPDGNVYLDQRVFVQRLSYSRKVSNGAARQTCHGPPDTSSSGL